MGAARAHPHITAGTRLVGLLGHPVEHSRSPAMHNAAFRSQGIDAVYVAFDVDPDRPRCRRERARCPRRLGSQRDRAAQRDGHPLPRPACLPPPNGWPPSTPSSSARTAAVGHNTDIAGFVAGLRAAWGRGPAGAECLVLGAGGAARAVVAGLQEEGARRIAIYNRTPSRADDLCAVASTWGDAPCDPIAPDGLLVAVVTADLIVNATSVGLGQTVKLSPLPVDMLSSRQVVMDLIYGAEPTALLRGARERGAMGIDGGEMLVQQAGLAYELWTGRTAPLDVMRREVVRA